MSSFILSHYSVDPSCFLSEISALSGPGFEDYAPQIFVHAERQFPQWFDKTPAKAELITENLLKRTCGKLGKREREDFLLCVGEKLSDYAECIKHEKIDNTNFRKLSSAIGLLNVLFELYDQKIISSTSLGPILNNGALLLYVKKDQSSKPITNTAANFFNDLAHSSGVGGGNRKGLKDFIRRAYAENHENNPTYWLSLMQTIVGSETDLKQIEKYCDSIINTSTHGNDDQDFVTAAGGAVLNICKRYNLMGRTASLATSAVFSPFQIAAGDFPERVTERMRLLSVYVEFKNDPIMCREGLVLRPDDAKHTPTVIWGEKKGGMNELLVCDRGLISVSGDYFKRPVRSDDQDVVMEWVERRSCLTGYRAYINIKCGVK